MIDFDDGFKKDQRDFKFVRRAWVAALLFNTGVWIVILVLFTLLVINLAAYFGGG